MCRQSPLISVVMSVFNDQNFLDEAIQSILNQTLGDFEFIIFDDCSTDGSTNILRSYAEKDDRIQLHINTVNVGLTKNLNMAISKAKGEFIARMDADDVSMPQRFERQVSFLRQSEKLMLCGSWTINIDENGREISVSQGPQDDAVLKWLGIFRPPFAHPTAMFRANTFLDSEVRYNEKYRTAQDFELWSRLAKIGDIEQLPEYLVKYRTDSNNVSSNRKIEQNRNAAKICGSNLTYYFPSLGCANGDMRIIALARFIFGVSEDDSIGVSEHIRFMLELQDEYIKTSKATKNSRKQIGQMTIRWLIQALFLKADITYKQRLIGCLLLISKPYLLILETLEMLSRKR